MRRETTCLHCESSPRRATAVGLVLQGRTVRAACLGSYLAADPLSFLVEVIGRRGQATQAVKPGGMSITPQHARSRYRG